MSADESPPVAEAQTLIRLDGQAALVTGGGRGIGRAIAEALLAAGCRVAVCGRTEPKTLPEAGGRTAEFMTCDVRDAARAQAMVAETAGRFGRLDILVNNAGGSPAADAATVSPRFSESIVALNLMAPLHLSQAANRVMQAQDNGGLIVNIASVSGVRGSPGTAAYGAAKAGLLSLTQSLAMEWGPKVRVNAVVAGLIATSAGDDHYGSDDGQVAIGARLPLRRMGRGEDVAGAVLYFASPLATYVSGARLQVDGGGEPPFYLDVARGAA